MSWGQDRISKCCDTHFTLLVGGELGGGPAKGNTIDTKSDTLVQGLIHDLHFSKTMPSRSCVAFTNG